MKLTDCQGCSFAVSSKIGVKCGHPDFPEPTYIHLVLKCPKRGQAAEQ